MPSFMRSVPVAALGALLVWGVPATAQASQDAAKRYFQNGVALITAAEPNYQDAFYQFQLAYQESAQSWKVLGNLGLCALKLERDADALAYYERYLQKGGGDIAPEERTAIEQDLLLLRGNLALVHLTSPVADLQVVDRRSGSPAPAQSYKLKDGVLDLQLRAGSHNLTATNGQRSLSWDVVLEPKGSTSHAFDFDAPAAPAAPAAATPAPETNKPAAPPASDAPPSSGGSSLRVPAYVTLGIGAVALGVGGYFLWQSSDYSNQSNTAFACNSRPIVGCSPAEKSHVQDLDDQSGAAKTRAVVSFGVGGAAVATGVILLIVSGSSSSEPKRAASWVPWLGPREVGVSGTF